MIASLLTLSAALAGDIDGLSWAWPEGEHRRYGIQNEITPPQFLWFRASRNKDARVVAWQTDLVADCVGEAPPSKKTLQASCRIEDFAMRAAAMAGDQAVNGREPLVQPILDELVARVEAATVHFVMRPDGRIVTFEVRGLPETERRESEMAEVIRVVLLRAFVGLELEFPVKGMAQGSAWGQLESRLFELPIQTGTMGAVEIVHRGSALGEGLVGIESVGRGVLQTQGGMVSLSAKYTARSVFSVADHAMRERQWTLLADPTAGSAGNEGTQGIPYYQSGVLRRLDADEAFAVGVTGEVAPPGTVEATTLNSWNPLVTTPTMLPGAER